MIDIITLRGAGEAYNNSNNMLRFVTKRLDYQRFRHIGDVVYPASIGPVNAERNLFGASLPDSVNTGKRNLADMIRDTPNRVGVLRYSLGALVVSDFLEDHHNGIAYTWDTHILFAGLVANPRRRPGDGLVGYGIAGQHSDWPSIRTYEVAHNGDGIPCCPDKNPLRRAADFLIAGKRPPQLTPTPFDWIRNPFGTRAQYDLAGRLIAGYLGAEHTSRYITAGHLNRLADTINGEVR